jgi:hypothetical protein
LHWSCGLASGGNDHNVKDHNRAEIARGAIEYSIDSANHSTREELIRDRERHEFIERFGFRTMRFTDAVTYENIEWVLEAIVDTREKQPGKTFECFFFKQPNPSPASLS